MLDFHVILHIATEECSKVAQITLDTFAFVNIFDVVLKARVLTEGFGALVAEISKVKHLFAANFLTLIPPKL